MTDRFLGWTAREVRIGSAQRWETLALDWQPQSIDNCSYARAANMIGVGGTLNGRRVVRIHELPSLRRVRALDDAEPLQHALASDGRTIIYTRSRNTHGADLVAHDGITNRTLLPASVAYRCTPALFPDAKKLAFESSAGAIEVFDVGSGERKAIGSGLAPAVDARGARIAFHDFHDIHVHDLASASTVTLRRHGLLPARTLEPWALSWSWDGKRIAFGTASGITGKATKFFTIDVESGERVEISDDFLHGLLFLDGGSA